MQITIRPAEIVSRLVAVLVVGFAIAWATQSFAQFEAAETAKMSCEELKQYVTGGDELSFVATYFLMVAFTGIYVLVVEGLAFVLRLVARSVAPAAEAA